MASNFEDPSLWRLTTGTGIPYKLLSFEGDFQRVTANANMRVLIQGSRLVEFMSEMFPPPLEFGKLQVPRYATLGGTKLAVSTVKFKSLNDSMPTDPLGFDLSAPLGTYFPVLELDLGFAPTPTGSQNPTDPKTFLEISGDVTGDFLHTTPKNLKWQPLKSDGTYEGTAEPNRVPDIPCTVMVPQTMWNVKWNMIKYTYFRDVIRPRLELMMGLVNSVPFTILYATHPTTLLFAGYQYNYSFTWRSDYVDEPLISLSMKFLEKRVIWRDRLDEDEQDDDESGESSLSSQGISPAEEVQQAAFGDISNGAPGLYGPYIIRGHNDFWRPGKGWSRLLINGRETYDRIDFNLLFQST